MDDDSLGDSSGAVCVQVELIAEKGDLEGGIQQFSETIELNPWITRVHLNLGVALAKQGHLEAAISQFERAITLKPEDADAHVALARSLAAQSKTGDAEKHYQQALQLLERQNAISSQHYNR